MKTSIFTQQNFKTHLKNNSSWTKYYHTAAGTLQLCGTNKSIYTATFCDEQAGASTDKPNLPLILVGTPFQIKVWHAALAIPAGKTITYQELAHTIGHPRAWRAVANALGQNKIAYFIPCHRIVRTNGSLGGYKWGIEKKECLLQSEKQSPQIKI